MKNKNNLKKILIIGENSYLASGLLFNNKNYIFDKIKRPYNSEQEYKKYDYIINFCIQPENLLRKLNETEMIDVKIARAIENTNTKQIFLSTRKVYGYSTELKTYSEISELKPYDWHSINKFLIEQQLQKINPKNLLILRIGNIIGNITLKKDYKTFMGWIANNINNNKKIICTIKETTKKDFITKDYLQYVLKETISNDLTGIYNVGAGFAISIKNLLCNLVNEEFLDFSNAINESDQFILDCKKLNKVISPLTKKKFLNECTNFKNNNWNKYLNQEL